MPPPEDGTRRDASVDAPPDGEGTKIAGDAMGADAPPVTPPDAWPSSSSPEGNVPNPVQPFTLPDLNEPSDLDIDAKRVTMLNDVDLHVKIELGRTRMLVEEVLKLGEGSVVELDKLAGDPVDVLVNERLIARGEVLVLNDNFCVRISEVLSNDPHRVSA